jgi:hypothetical protein
MVFATFMEATMSDEQATVLVTVKAYPGLSVRRGETVCVAGVRIDGGPPRWMRLYPVAFGICRGHSGSRSTR